MNKEIIDLLVRTRVGYIVDWIQHDALAEYTSAVGQDVPPHWWEHEEEYDYSEWVKEQLQLMADGTREIPDCSFPGVTDEP